MSHAPRRRAANVHVAFGLALVLVSALTVAGCARRVVIDPDEVHRHNTEWIQRRPAVPADAGAPSFVVPRPI